MSAGVRVSATYSFACFEEGSGSTSRLGKKNLSSPKAAAAEADPLKPATTPLATRRRLWPATTRDLKEFLELFLLRDT